MLSVYKTFEGKLKPADIKENEVCIFLENPTKEELNLVQETHNIEKDFLRAALDQEEVSRLEVEESNQILVLLNAPVEEDTPNNFSNYNTMPVGIIMTPSAIVIVTLEIIKSIELFKKNYIRRANTNKKTRLAMQIMYAVTIDYLRELRKIDNFIDSIEENLYNDLKNDYLIHLLVLEKNLVYFQTALKTNEQVLRKLLRSKILEQYEEDEDLVDDIFIELTQAQEMATINTKIIRSIRDATASVISNNLNRVMKILASFTIILTVPTMIFSFFGMNSGLGFFEKNNIGTIIISIFSLVITILLYKIMKKQDMF